MKSLSLFILLSATVALATNVAENCRLQAANQVVQDLNKNGRLWKSRLDRKSGDVTILVEGGKTWLNLADEEVYYCDSWSQKDVCIDYKFQDPETYRVEHQVQMEVVKEGCILRGYQNLVGARPWR